MIQKLQKIFAGALLPLMAVVLLLSGQVEAAEYACTVALPVETVVTGENAPAGEKFQIVLEAAEEGAPMPEKTIAEVKDTGKTSFGPIRYTVPGDYQYRVSQKAGDTKNFTYDETVYTVTVRVTNAEDGGLNAEIWAIKDGEQNKTDAIKFTNSYKAPEKPKTDTVKTGDNQNFILWAGLAAAAVLLLVVWVVIKRHRSETE